MKDWKTIVIIALLLLIIAGIILWPKKEDSAAIKNARDSVAQLMEANTINSMQVKTLETQLTEFNAKKTIDSTRFVREITVKNQQLAKKRVRIDTVFKDNEVVQDYLQTADSVFAMMRERIDSLEAEKAFQASLYNELIFIKGKEVSNLEMIIVQKDLIVADQAKTIKKSRRGKKLLKVGVVALPVAALLLGSQL